VSTSPFAEIQKRELARPLSDAERARKKELDAIISRGLKTFIEVGNALLEYRESRLYRESYPTFEAWVQAKHGITRQHAGRLIAAATVANNIAGEMEPIGYIPESESVLRPVAKLSPESQRIVMLVATQTAPDHKPTAAWVKSTVDVLEDLSATGAVDTGDGVMTPVHAAILQAVQDRALAIKDRITQNSPWKRQEGACFTVKASLALEMLQDALAGLSGDEEVKILTFTKKVKKG